MTRTDYWRLTIHYFPAAAKAGVCAVPYIWPGCTDDTPQFYQPHDIDFSNPPVRKDFLAVVATTPWMSVWEKDLLPLIEAHQWPIVEPCHKAASVDLMLDGKSVGRLEIRRERRYENAPYFVPFVSTYLGGDVMDLIIRKVHGTEKRTQAKAMVDANKHRILERLIDSGDTSINQLLEEVQRVLVEAGLAKFPRGGFMEPVAK